MTDTPSLLRVIWREKWLFIAALMLLYAARLQLSLRRTGDPRRQDQNDIEQPAPPLRLGQRVAWNIEQAARFVPRATCLVRAKAGQRLLALKGYGSRIHVGVCRTGATGFEAHAWLVGGELLILGGTEDELQRFTTLIGNSR